MWVTSAEFLEVIGLLASEAFLPIGRAFPGWVTVTTIPTLTLSFTTFATGTMIEYMSPATTPTLVLPFRPVHLIDVSSLWFVHIL